METCSGPEIGPRNRLRVNRYYDPVTGEFVSVDPDGAETGQPYTYASDDPIGSSDPTGQASSSTLESTVFKYVALYPYAPTAYVNSPIGDLSFDFDYHGTNGFRWTVDLLPDAQAFLEFPTLVDATAYYAIDGKPLSNPTYSKFTGTAAYPFHGSIRSYTFASDPHQLFTLTAGHTVTGSFIVSSPNGNYAYFNWKVQIFR